MALYYKLATAIVGAFITATAGVWDDGRIAGTAEWSAVAAAVAMVVSTWLVPELSAGAARAAKGLVAVVLALAGIVPGLAADGHLDRNDVFTMAVAAATAVGILVVPNVRYVRARKVVSPLG